MRKAIKKAGILFFIAALVITGLVSCVSSSKEKFTPGTYVTEADGHNGKVKVEVVFSE